MITKEEVRDGYLNDLPSDIIDKLMRINKFINDTCKDEIKSHDYDDIRNDSWCKSALDEFCTTPKNKSHVGSVRVYKKGKRFRCMIQITGHVINNREDFIHELFHEFIRDVHSTVRPKIRSKFDMTITCESEHGEHFEGFDVWLKQKDAKEIWEKFEDKKTLKITPMKESYELNLIDFECINFNEEYDSVDEEMDILFDMIQEGTCIEEATDELGFYLNESTEDEYYSEGKKGDKRLKKFLKRHDFQADEDSSKKLITGSIKYKDKNGDERRENIAIGKNKKLEELKASDKEKDKTAREEGGTYRRIYINKNDAKSKGHSADYQLYHQIALLNKDSAIIDKEMDAILKDAKDHIRNMSSKMNLSSRDSDPSNYYADVRAIQDLKNAGIDTKNYFDMCKTSSSRYKEMLKDLEKNLTNLIIHDMGPKVEKLHDEIERMKNKLKNNREKFEDLDNTISQFNENIKKYEKYKKKHGEEAADEKYPLITRSSKKGKLEKAWKVVKDAIEREKRIIADLEKEFDKKYDKYATKKKKEEIRNKATKELEMREKEYKNGIKSRESFAKKYVKESVSCEPESIVSSISDLPIGLQNTIINMNKSICNSIMESIDNSSILLYTQKDKYSNLLKENTEVGYTELHVNSNGEYSGSIVLTPQVEIHPTESNETLVNTTMKSIFESVWRNNHGEYHNNYYKNLTISGKAPNYYYEFTLEPDYVKHLWNYINNPKDIETITESTDKTPTPEYNVDMSMSEARRTIGTLSANIIGDIQRNKLPNQYTANIINNIVTKNLLPVWAKGYRRLHITIDPKHSGIFQFKAPAMTQDFISRFVYGRESINGFLHKNPDIRITMSPKIFKSLKNRDDLFTFLKNAINYYNKDFEKYANQIMHTIMKLNSGLKHSIANSRLSGIVTLSLQMLLMFDNVDMSNKNAFKIDKNDINSVTTFIKNICTKYAAPEKEKKKIMDDLQRIIDQIKGNTEYDENVKTFIDLPSIINEFYSGKFTKDINYYREETYKEYIDTDWSTNNPNTELRFLQEKTKVKKLKRIPRDLVAYITIEGESIRNANDKMMIASYCLDKLEIIEWYIELLEVGSEKYIVPHPLAYLQSLRTQLLQCYDKIMQVKIIPPSERPLIDINYGK